MSWLNVKHAMYLDPWIRVPLMWPEPGLEDVEAAQTPEGWARVFAEAWWEDFATEKPRRGEVDLLIDILVMHAKRAPNIWPGADVFLHLPHPRDVPITVSLDLVEIDEEEDRDTALRELTHADADYGHGNRGSMVGSTEPIIRPVTEREGIWSMIRVQTGHKATKQADAFPGGAPPGGTGRSPIPG